jgi:gas vesicle protein
MNNFLLGLGIGITVGVLFAPKSGDETRQQLGQKADEGTDYLLKQGQQVRDTAAELVEKGKSALQDQKSRLANAAQGAVHGAMEGAQRGYQGQA